MMTVYYLAVAYTDGSLKRLGPYDLREEAVSIKERMEHSSHIKDISLNTGERKRYG